MPTRIRTNLTQKHNKISETLIKKLPLKSNYSDISSIIVISVFKTQKYMGKAVLHVFIITLRRGSIWPFHITNDSVIAINKGFDLRHRVEKIRKGEEDG